MMTAAYANLRLVAIVRTEREMASFAPDPKIGHTAGTNLNHFEIDTFNKSMPAVPSAAMRKCSRLG
jgi:hypothetical protein